MAYWQRAFVLHRRPFRETSLLVDLFTEDHGRVSVLAKGVRSRRSSLKGCLQPFTPLLVHLSGANELKVLRNAEPVCATLPLAGITLYSGLYVNELLVRILKYEAHHATLFSAYLDCLLALCAHNDSPETALRQFELEILTSLGCGVDFLHCALSGEPVCVTMNYYYRESTGFVKSSLTNDRSFSGYELHALAACHFPDTQTLKAAKRFTRMALKPYLGDRPLKSRELFASLRLKQTRVT